MPDEIDIEFDDPEEEDAGQFGLEQIEQEDAEEERQAELSRRRAEHDLRRRQDAQERRRQRLTREGRPPENLEDLALPGEAGQAQAGEQGGDLGADKIVQSLEGQTRLLEAIEAMMERWNDVFEEMREARQVGVFGP